MYFPCLHLLYQFPDNGVRILQHADRIVFFINHVFNRRLRDQLKRYEMVTIQLYGFADRMVATQPFDLAQPFSGEGGSGRVLPVPSP